MGTRRLRHLGVEDLIGCAIVTAEGERLGRVVDLLVSPAPEYRVQSLIFGRVAWLYRLHMLRPLAEKYGVRLQLRKVPWEAVDDVSGGAVILRSGASAEAIEQSASPTAGDADC